MKNRVMDRSIAAFERQIARYRKKALALRDKARRRDAEHPDCERTDKAKVLLATSIETVWVGQGLNITVGSQTDCDTFYAVVLYQDQECTCDCPDFQTQDHRLCKHLRAAAAWVLTECNQIRKRHRRMRRETVAHAALN